MKVAMCGIASLLFFCAVSTAQDQTADELLKEADAAFKKGEQDKAVALAGKAIDANPKFVPAYLYRAAMLEALAKFKEAIADYDQALKLDAKLPIAWQRRGLVQFKAGNIKESIADFDKFIELEPKAKVSHWQRGISYYYAGMYKEGKEQFEGYQTFDDNDVENAVWRYLCMVPLVGKEKAQKDILKIAKDDRIPMQEVYDLFAGKAKPQDVMDAAKAGKPKEDELSKRLFYTHLYLGLYYHSEGDTKQALAHLDLAASKYAIGHYMWDVARVHRDILLKKK